MNALAKAHQQMREDGAPPELLRQPPSSQVPAVPSNNNQPTLAVAVIQPSPPSIAEAPPIRGVGQITKAIANVMKEVHVVAKNGENSFHRYRYAQMQDILKEITPLLGKHGLVIFQTETGRSMFDGDNVIAIEYGFTVVHESGEMWPHQLRQTGVSRCRDSKGGWDDKSLNKAHTAARKYFLLSLFQIPTGEEDDADKGASDGGFVTDEQATIIRDLIDEVGADIKRFCAYFKVEGIAKIPAKQYDRAVAALNAKRRAS